MSGEPAPESVRRILHSQTDARPFGPEEGGDRAAGEGGRRLVLGAVMELRKGDVTRRAEAVEDWCEKYETSALGFAGPGSVGRASCREKSPPRR